MYFSKFRKYEQAQKKSKKSVISLDRIFFLCTNIYYHKKYYIHIDNILRAVLKFVT